VDGCRCCNHPGHAGRTEYRPRQTPVVYPVVSSQAGTGVALICINRCDLENRNPACPPRVTCVDLPRPRPCPV
jgi:hypothetical protein